MHALSGTSVCPFSVAARHHHAAPHATALPRRHRTVLPGPLRSVPAEAAAASSDQSNGAVSTAALIRAADKDGDGRLTVEEVAALLDAVQKARPPAPAAAPAPAPAAPAPPATWDLQLYHSIFPKASSSSSSTPLTSALVAFISNKLSNQHKNRASASDLLWTFLGAFSAALILGVAATQVKTWPLVGQWHQQGLGLLIGSFGTISVLLFARPAGEVIMMWNLLVGHLVSITVVMAVVQAMGSTPLSRAIAMGLAIAGMMWTDSVHPPGGALVLLAVDSAVVQGMGPWFYLYPSLAFCAAVMLPIGFATNWLKRNVKFDFPKAAPAGSNDAYGLKFKLI